MKPLVCSTLTLLTFFTIPSITRAGNGANALKPTFRTSDRCLACHNGLAKPSGEDVSIGFDWRASIMANSARDPYWQASVRREDIDHPKHAVEIEDGCADCHMPIARYEAKLQGQLGQVFAHLPFRSHPDKNAAAEDGVSCLLCHQIGKEKLGGRASFNGNFVVDPPDAKNNRPEYGPFVIEEALQRVMETSTGGFRPTDSPHIRESEMCATCHTLYTKSINEAGQVIGEFPEQMPYLEWLNSSFANAVSCQTCHMPEVEGPAPIAAVLGPLRSGARLHTFIGGNRFMLLMLNRYRDDLDVAAMPLELTRQAQRTGEFLQTQAARVTLKDIAVTADKLTADVYVENLTGHKLPTAFPSRRAWLHFVVQDRSGKTVFESGALNPDGSIKGNINDTDPERYEPHFREITSEDQVEIYEPILKDDRGRVTTGLSAAFGYLKDTRLLPAGFSKQSANKDIAVVGDAANDPNFEAGGALERYSVSLGNAQGPFHIVAELWYQPIGFRWVHNLAPYKAVETQRVVQYYNSMPESASIVLARAEATR